MADQKNSGSKSHSSTTKAEEGRGELERTLGLGTALTIGIGTMVGAGIFVFPGIAGGYAGPAAVLSFLIAGSIALLVAVSATELATAMPQSGGGYYFISRTFGSMSGSLVGIAQYVGLIFASSFYLVGFGEYAMRLLPEWNLSLGDPVILITLGAALILTLINMVGTKGAGKLQNGVVIILSGILFMLFFYGILSATGVVGEASLPKEFAPEGYMPVFTTTALIFTSYLGFVQIATVAGEIKKPQKNLPRALIGSVLIVTVLYVMAIFVSTSYLSPEELGQLGETAMVEVARVILGKYGGMIVLLAGLLATLSSANASILSSSRAIYSVSSDRLVPPFFSRLNKKFGTPHIALFTGGIAISALTIFGRIEVLAEVASLLHLVIYGLICVSLLALRRKKPLWYAPTFKVKGAKLAAGLGAISCFALIAFMQKESIIIGGGVIAVTSIWYLIYARNRELTPPKPAHIAPSIRRPRTLVPVNIDEAKELPGALINAFRDIEILVLGYKEVTEQSSPEQSRAELTEEEREALESVVGDVRKGGLNVEVNSVFTRDFAESVNRYVKEKNIHAVLTPRNISSIKRLLVPVYSEDQLTKKLATVLHDLSESSNLPVTLLSLSSREEASEDVRDEESLEQKAISLLRQTGLGTNDIRSKSVQVEQVAEAVKEIAGDEDVVVLAETGKSDRESFFKTIHNEIEELIDGPLLVIMKKDNE